MESVLRDLFDGLSAVLFSSLNTYYNKAFKKKAEEFKELCYSEVSDDECFSLDKFRVIICTDNSLISISLDVQVKFIYYNYLTGHCSESSASIEREEIISRTKSGLSYYKGVGYYNPEYFFEDITLEEVLLKRTGLRVFSNLRSKQLILQRISKVEPPDARYAIEKILYQ